jgi:hypothetical protein
MNRSKPKSKLLIAMTLLASLASPGAEAQKPQCARFLAIEEERDQHRACGINSEGLKAAIASVMRQNGYAIEQDADKGTSCLSVSFGINPLPISSNSCAVSLRLTFSFLPELRFLFQSRAPWGATYDLFRVPICELGAVSVGPIPMQNQQRENLIQFTERCILEEERMRR